MWGLTNRKNMFKFVGYSNTCQKYKITNYRLKTLYHFVTNEQPLETVSIDFYGPFPNAVRSLKYIVVIVDNLSKYSKLYPIKTANATTAIKSLEKFIDQNGYPKNIVRDNGTQFTFLQWRNKMKMLDIKLIYMSIRHPQSNKSERVNRDLGE
jgi:transposase InsO family protein